MEIFENEYADDMEYEAALLLGLKALNSAIEDKPKVESVEIGVADIGKKFRRLSEEEVSALIEKL